MATLKIEILRKMWVLVFLSVIHVSQGALWMADVYELARECIKLPDVNGTEDDVTDLLMGYLPDTKSGMCMLRCMETHVGILVQDQYDLRGAYLFFRKTFPENPFYRNIERGVRFCGHIVAKRRTVDMDRCQYAHMVAACIKRRIKFIPGCRAAFYRPFVWKNNNKKVPLKPAVQKYFEPDKRKIARYIFEVITKPTQKYRLEDVQGVLESSEEIRPQWLPPRGRKGKRRMKDKIRGKKKKDELDFDDDESFSWDKSDKSRRHKPKKFRI